MRRLTTSGMQFQIHACCRCTLTRLDGCSGSRTLPAAPALPAPRFLPMTLPPSCWRVPLSGSAAADSLACGRARLRSVALRAVGTALHFPPSVFFVAGCRSSASSAGRSGASALLSCGGRAAGAWVPGASASGATEAGASGGGGLRLRARFSPAVSLIAACGGALGTEGL
jgi:hypothetical protein